MPTPTAMPARDVLDREFLEIRAKLLELAASFDRLGRGDGDVRGDRRMELIRKGLDILRRDEGGRAEAIQLLFSREYEEDWRKKFGV